MKTSKKTVKNLVNSIEDAVTESLSGFRYCYPQLEYQAAHRVVLAPNIEGRRDKVSVICGGGSGHEPFAAGFVGNGMLTAAVAGSIFAAPPSVHITYAIERIKKYNKAGILVIIPNYTGDCLNFGIAIEKARQAGITVADIIVGEDCSIPVNELGVAGKRGLPGLVFAMKIAGALAEQGCIISEIVKILQYAVQNMATYAVGLTACAIPGQSLMFELADDEIECGMGVHGEAGYEKIKLGTVKEVVALMLKQIYDSLSLVHGESVAVMVNNFGALSQLEEGIVVHEVITQLEAMNAKVMRVYSGLLMTSLNSAGIHITLLKLPEDIKTTLLKCLDDPTDAPRWPGCVYSIPSTATRKSDELQIKRRVEKIGAEMSVQEQRLLKRCLENACAVIIEKENYLNDLDRGCGDGDCGTTLKRFADDILQNLDNFHLSHPVSILSELGNIAEDRMGGTSGALYCLLFTNGAKELSSIQNTDNWPTVWSRIFRSGLDCLMKYGKAKPGDRTMIDVLDAACATYAMALANSSSDVYEEVEEAAWRACEATKNMKPRAGRASYVKQSLYLREVDAGAYAAASWISVVTRTIRTFTE